MLPPDSPQAHQPSPNNNALPPKPPHLIAQAAASSFRQKKPPMPSPPMPPMQSSSKMDQEVSWGDNNMSARHTINLSFVVFSHNIYSMNIFYYLYISHLRKCRQSLKISPESKFIKQTIIIYALKPGFRFQRKITLYETFFIN